MSEWVVPSVNGDGITQKQILYIMNLYRNISLKFHFMKNADLFNHICGVHPGILNLSKKQATDLINSLRGRSNKIIRRICAENGISIQVAHPMSIIKEVKQEENTAYTSILDQLQ